MLNQKDLKKVNEVPDEIYFRQPEFKRLLDSSVANITKKRIPVSLINDPAQGVAWTTGASICINLGADIFHSSMTRKQKAEMIMGILGHECAHILWSETEEKQIIIDHVKNNQLYGMEFIPQEYLSAAEEITAYMQANPLSHSFFGDVLCFLDNCIEDAYINPRIMHQYPGSLARGLSRFYEIAGQQKEPIENVLNKNVLSGLQEAMIHYIFFNGTYLGDPGDYTDRIEAMYVYADWYMSELDANERKKAASGILSMMWDYIRDLLPESNQEANTKPQSDSGGDDGQSGDGNETGDNGSGSQNGEQQGGNDTSPGTPTRNSKPNHQPGNENNEHGNDNNPSTSSGGTSGEQSGANAESQNNNSGSTMTEQEIMDAYAKVAQDFKKALSDGMEIPTMTKEQFNALPDAKNSDCRAGNNTSSSLEHTMKELDKNLAEEFAEERIGQEAQKELAQLQLPAADNMYPHLVTKFQRSYSGLNMLNAIRRQTKVISHVIADQAQDILETEDDQMLKGLVLGKRLSNNLFRPDQKVFESKLLPGDKPKVVVTFMVDESGSMDDKTKEVLQALVILYDFCKILGIPVSVIGHHVDGNCIELNQYTDFESRDDDIERMMNLEASGSNYDAYALRYVLARMDERPEEIRITIVLSDGQPTRPRSMTVDQRILDMQKVLKEYRSRGHIIVAASVDKSSHADIKKIYGADTLQMDELNKIAPTFIRILEKYM